MRLPSLTLIIAAVAMVWCIAGVNTHGWMLLIYPAAWLAILGAFILHNKMYPIRTAADQEVELENPHWNENVETDSKISAVATE